MAVVLCLSFSFICLIHSIWVLSPPSSFSIFCNLQSVFWMVIHCFTCFACFTCLFYFLSYRAKAGWLAGFGL